MAPPPVIDAAAAIPLYNRHIISGPSYSQWSLSDDRCRPIEISIDIASRAIG
jgi:hypothetical protein